MIELISRDWKPLLLCFLLALLVWFLVRDRRLRPAPASPPSIPEEVLPLDLDPPQ